MICKDYQNLEDGEELLFHALEIGFRGLGLEYVLPDTRHISTKHFQDMVGVVSNSGDEETVADLLQAWITHSYTKTSPEFLKLWATHPFASGACLLLPRGCGGLSYTLL